MREEYFMKIVSISQMVELNEKIRNENLPFKVHLRDACAMQSLSIEALTSEEKEDRNKLYALIKSYFSIHKMSVVYTDDNHFSIQ